jgi:lysophospholipase L1-like esterase
MYRWIIACLVFALIAQGAGVEGQTTSSGLDCTPEIDYKVAPSIVENNEAFHLVVIGDSIAWGAGLEKGKKYSFLVAEWLSKQLERPVDVRILAHTGATIGKISEAPIQLPDLSGENPTLMEQADSIPDPKHVDMILVSGGINDVTVNEIIKLLYFPSFSL